MCNLVNCLGSVAKEARILTLVAFADERTGHGLLNLTPSTFCAVPSSFITGSGYMGLFSAKPAADHLAVGILALELLVDIDRWILGGIRAERTGLQAVNASHAEISLGFDAIQGLTKLVIDELGAFIVSETRIASIYGHAGNLIL